MDAGEGLAHLFRHPEGQANRRIRRVKHRPRAVQHALDAAPKHRVGDGEGGVDVAAKTGS